MLTIGRWFWYFDKSAPWTVKWKRIMLCLRGWGVVRTHCTYDNRHLVWKDSSIWKLMFWVLLFALIVVLAPISLPLLTDALFCAVNALAEYVFVVFLSRNYGREHFHLWQPTAVLSWHDWLERYLVWWRGKGLLQWELWAEKVKYFSYM